MGNIPSYEQLLEWIGQLTRPDEPTQRIIRWLTDARAVGVSRTYQNRIEIFLAGTKITPSSRAVSEAIEYQPLWRSGAHAAAFEANRLLLPAAGHFDQVAAFLCTELLRNGARYDPKAAFLKTEPVIQMAIERLRLSDQALLGLAGELLLINATCQLTDDSSVARVVEAWAGWQPSLRDFVWGSVSTEVKTTTHATSRHHMQGIHQLELRESTTGELEETKLYLVSIGLQLTDPHENSFTVPSLTHGIDAMLRSIGRHDTADNFLSHVSEYGSGSGFGYDHYTMADDAAFARSFVVAFVRTYDLTDKNVLVLRSADISPHLHVDASTMSFSIDLPTTVSGDLNPLVGLNQAAQAIMGEMPNG